jgi:hypothetical protein
VDLLRNAEAIRREWLAQAAGYVSPYAPIAEAEPPAGAGGPEPEPEHDDPEAAEQAAARALFLKRIAGHPQTKKMMEGIRWGRLDAVRDVLKLPNRGEILREAKNQEGCAVDYACMLGTFSVSQDAYKSELHKRAAEYWMDGANAMQLPKILLEGGADPNARLSDGCFPAILWAAMSNNLDLVVLLLAYGADPTLKEMDGISALSCAMSNGEGGHRNDHLVEIIEAAPAIRAHFLENGKVEWPIPAPPPPPPPEPEPAPEEEECGCCEGMEHVPLDFGKARPDFAERMTRVRDQFLAIAVEGGRSTEV